MSGTKTIEIMERESTLSDQPLSPQAKKLDLVFHVSICRRASNMRRPKAKEQGLSQ